MISVFIVEDDIAIRNLYLKLLKIFNIQVCGMAENGLEAVNRFKTFNHKPDIIIMDHRMPVKDGIDATKEIVQLDQKAKVIFTSADKSVRNSALSMGAKEFIKKPFSLEKLITVIHYVVSV